MSIQLGCERGKNRCDVTPGGGGANKLNEGHKRQSVFPNTTPLFLFQCAETDHLFRDKPITAAITVTFHSDWARNWIKTDNQSDKLLLLSPEHLLRGRSQLESFIRTACLVWPTSISAPSSGDVTPGGQVEAQSPLNSVGKLSLVIYFLFHLCMRRKISSQWDRGAGINLSTLGVHHITFLIMCVRF